MSVAQRGRQHASVSRPFIASMQHLPSGWVSTAIRFVEPALAIGNAACRPAASTVDVLGPGSPYVIHQLLLGRKAGSQSAMLGLSVLASNPAAREIILKPNERSAYYVR